MGNNGREVGIDNLGVLESHFSRMEQFVQQKKKLMCHFNFIFFNGQAFCLSDMSGRCQTDLENLNENTSKWHEDCNTWRTIFCSEQ